jgi:acyl-CoA dehydrogenase
VPSARAREVDDLVRRMEEFIRQLVLPLEDRYDGVIEAAGGDQARSRLQNGSARPWAPGRARAGRVRRTSADEAGAVASVRGCGIRGVRCVALNATAPNEGIHLLESRGDTRTTHEVGLLAHAEVRSAFAMTEPSPGAGSDPSAVQTQVERVPGGWRINGNQLFITGADGADLFIIMVRTAGQPGSRGGGTAFLAPASNPGIHVAGTCRPWIARWSVGHCEVTFDGLKLSDDAVLGEVDKASATSTYASVGADGARDALAGTAVRARDGALANRPGEELQSTAFDRDVDRP